LSGYIETYRGMVTNWHCDHQGHMNTVQFHAMFDQAGWQLLTQAGYGAARLRQEKRGFVDVRMVLEYLGEMMVNDPVVIESGVLRLGTTSLTYRSRMRRGNDGDIVSTATCTTVHFDLDARKKAPFPADLREAFEALSVPEED
jgi:acyl-CoA thioester hydrolase